MPTQQKLIGRREFACLPDFDIEWIEAKIDTGAYTSALHCSYIEFINKNGISSVSFKLLDEDHPQFNDILFTANVHKIKKVKSSNGVIQQRYIIRTRVMLNGRELLTEFSLTDRSAMRYPLLIGRKTLKGNFIVDVERIHIGGNPYQSNL
jgi:hypothetical protein